MRGKDDGSYDSLTRWDESPDFTNNKRGQRSPNKKKRPKMPTEKNEGKERRDNVTIFFSTLVLQSSTMIFMIESLLFCHFHITSGYSSCTTT